MANFLLFFFSLQNPWYRRFGLFSRKSSLAGLVLLMFYMIMK
jgi:hypothetical protein